MATRVVTNNSSTQHRSGGIPQTASGAKLSTPGAQPENTPSTRSTPDEVVNQILIRAKSPLVEEDARKLAEILEKMLEPRYQIDLRTRRRCFRGLVKICGEYGVLPSSYIIPESKIKKLGDDPAFSGGFSGIWSGFYEGDKPVAIKVIQYYQADDAQQTKKTKKNFCREVITWKRLSHPNVLELIGVMMDDEKCTMVSSWMENGNIVEFLRENPQANPLKLLEDATRGLQYLHSVDLAHGDLKGGNILVSDDGCACLADVGLTRMAGDLGSATAASNASTSTGGVTLRWSPPELLDPERFGAKRDGPTKKSDVYSMGMAIYEVLTDRTPFYEYTELVTLRKIIEGVRPKKPIFAITRGYTEELWEMTTACWEEDPAKRPPVDHVFGMLRSAAGQWKPKYGELVAQDDWSPTSPTEGSDLENESEPFTPTSASSPQQLATETLPPAPTPAIRAPLGEDEVREVAKTLEKMLHGIPPDSYIIPGSKIKKLGDSPVSYGGFSEVWPGVYDGDKFVAIKVLRHPRAHNVEGIKRMKENFCREVVTWKRLSHPNVLKLIGVVMGDKECAMVSPWMGKENIVEFLRREPQANPLKLLEDAARGLQYLHSVNLVHGDMKGKNILVSDDGCACLASFGFTRIVDDLNPSTSCGTLRWSPPERLDPERFGPTSGSTAKYSDIYSMGMTIYEVLTDRSPFYEDNDVVVVLRIFDGMRPKVPDFATTRGYTKELWEMTTTCWKEDPTKRPTVDYVLGVLKDAAEQWKPNRV